MVGLSGEVSCQGNSWPAFSSRAVSGVVGREIGLRRCRGLAVGIAIGAVVCSRREGEVLLVTVAVAAAVAVAVSDSTARSEEKSSSRSRLGVVIIGDGSAIGTI